MADTYLPGWKGARLAYWDADATPAPAYVPVACITSRNESNVSRVKEKVNVCTQGKIERTVTAIDRTVSVSGEVTDANSLEELRAIQNSKAYHKFRVYKSLTTDTPLYFKAIITNLNADYPAGQDEDATFTMDLEIDKDGYKTTDV